MDEPFLPWWLVLLLGMWAASLAIWQQPSLHREIRMWAGLLNLVYLGLIFLALGFVPRLVGPGSSFLLQIRMTDVGAAICVPCSLVAGVGMLGRISLRGRCICYLVLTISNSIFCFLIQGPEIAIGLLFVAIASAKPLVQEWFRTSSRAPLEWLAELFRFTDEPSEISGKFWLIAGMNGILAFVLMGTLAYSLRIETTRNTSSPRYSALPARDQLVWVQSSPSESIREPKLLELAFGHRADVVVMMAAIVFLYLAMSLKDPPFKSLVRTDTETKSAADKQI